MKIIAITHEDKLWTPVAEYAEKCSWKAGKNLSMLMKNNSFTEWERVFVALDDDLPAGFCTLSKEDCIAGVPYTPYVGFVFVGEQYRGNRLSEKLCLFAISYAEKLGFDKIYLVSDHVNLYEKYGFIKVDEKEAPWGAMETIFMYKVK